jgi:hypothetical protein
MYLKLILYFLTWPALIVLSYHLVKYFVKKYSDVLERVEE